MRSLLDVNFLIALLDREHVSHDRAVEWLLENRAFGWSTCPMTELGCMRILSNRRYSTPLDAVEVLSKLSTLKASSRYAFWPDDVSLTDGTAFNVAAVRGHQQLTDAYLLALAVKRDGRLVTFDRSIPLSAVCGATAEHLVIL